MKVILLSAKQGGGKTTLQKALMREWIKRHTTAVCTQNFADVLYEMHDSVLKVLNKYWPNRGLVKDGPLLQVLGTQWGRDTIDKDIWVKIMRVKLEARKIENVGLVVVGDCRFENEFDAFPDALRVRLYCPENIRKERCEMWRENKVHQSEIGLDQYYLNGKFDLVLKTNKMPIDDCVEAVLRTLETDFISHRSRIEKKSPRIFL